MSTPQAKRQRLNEAAKTLHKPFKSPFRTPLKPSPSYDSPLSDLPSSDPPDAATPVTKPSLAKPIATPASMSKSPAKPLASRPHPATPIRGPQKRSIPSKPSLAHEILQLRSEIQILTQAHTLATSSKDEDLSKLIDTWRTASRAAAEELFATTRDRVNRMGGVGAWKEREREQREWRRKRDLEEFEAERERLEEARENAEGDQEQYEYYGLEEQDSSKAEEEEPSNSADDESFTMDMMLKTLNVDLKLIGYDSEAQRWEG
ncbi:hypothetical protein BS50DRAFT_573830 [Corynespora cassiicola Philippines]|uniref:DNA repair protein Dds20/Mei5 n=1 Tax=Corynespora cassiicola Philippines TaxID=1448308 RepID=A0A2T2NNX3_CORCC|nr:hypothetical protein BS50DRAFT_573830 [Corynespora cassiicola Philippines]